jgi:hypothetical protein
MRPRHLPTVMITAVLLFAANGTVAGAADKPAPAQRDCFLSNNWEGWSAPGDGDALLLRVGLHDIYRVDLTPGSHARRGPGEFLVNRIRGSNWICSHLDLDLTISDPQGFRSALIARSLRKLTLAEVSAIPKKDLP